MHVLQLNTSYQEKTCEISYFDVFYFGWLTATSLMKMHGQILTLLIGGPCPTFQHKAFDDPTSYLCTFKGFF